MEHSGLRHQDKARQITRMVHSVKDKTSHKKSRKRSRKEQSSSASSSSESSSDESPPPQRSKDKMRKAERRKQKEEDPNLMKKRMREDQVKTYKKDAGRKKESRKRESSSTSSSSSSSDENTPPRQKKEKRMDMKVDEKRSHHKDVLDKRKETAGNKRGDESRDHRDRRKDKNEASRDSRRGGRDSKDRRDRKRESSPVKIKKEEDFDKRQEDLRRKRRDNERRNQNRHSHHDVHVKQEPESDDDRRRRHDRGDNKQGGRPRNRNDIEKERRENDARRAEAWQKREKQGGQNAEALIQDSEEPKEKEKPNLGLSGALTEDTNAFRGVVIKYSEPPEARVPKKKWRLYPFKGDEALKVLHLHRQSAYLLGKLRRIADIPIDHPSCSKQHAVLQFRIVGTEREDGMKKRVVRPYIIDLDSSNGTFVNNQKIEPRRYVELKEKDVLKFAFSSREYVLIHDKSDTTGVDLSEEESDE